MNKKLKKNWTAVHYNYLGSTIFKDYEWIGFDDTFDVAVKVSSTNAPPPPPAIFLFQGEM